MGNPITKPRRTRRAVQFSASFDDQRFIDSFLPATHSGCRVLGYEVNRDNIVDVDEFAWALLAEELYSKYDDGSASAEKSRTTWDKFFDAELHCLTTNNRLSSDGRVVSDPVFVEMRSWIERCLGDISEEQVCNHAAFGPGATFLLRRKHRAMAYKYSGTPESTLGNARLARAAIGESPLWTREAGFTGNPSDGLHIVAGNRVVTVPKNRKTDRTIAIEPRMNIYIQKGIGSMMRSRLRRKGVNLNDQTVNQVLAREGSVTGRLATVDLSMASDTVARVLPHILLPETWVALLEQSRSPFGLLPSGQYIKYQKFSSMGNGYTFELESLIFSALCASLIKVHGGKGDRFSVYGDDIIISSNLVPHLLSYLDWLGFTPNQKKSHWVGGYRESCGKHYFHGSDVTPFYIRRPVKDLSDLFLVHNNVWRWGERTLIDVSETVRGLRRLAPSKWRKPRLPDGFGDGAFIGHVDELQLNSHPYGWDCWQAEVLGTVAKRDLEDPSGSSVASLALMERRCRENQHGTFNRYFPVTDEELFQELSVSSNRERRAVIKTTVPRTPARTSAACKGGV